MLFDEVFIGLITDSGYNEDVAYDFLDDLHKEFTIFYKNNLGFIKRQQNLKQNVYNKVFLEQFNSVFDKFKKNRSGIIKMDAVDED